MYYAYITAKEIMKILIANGWELDRINGSHHIFVKAGYRSIPVSVHGNKDLGTKGKQILKEAGIKV